MQMRGFLPGLILITAWFAPYGDAQPPAGKAQETPPFAQDIVAAHNAVRARIGVPPLAWSDELAKFAQEWANTLATSGAFFHRRTTPYGENLFESSGFSPTPLQVVNAWASEAKNYQYETNACSGVCGHYTQVVWRDTKAVGCGAVRSAKREIWVCNYEPFGNIVGERPY